MSPKTTHQTFPVVYVNRDRPLENWQQRLSVISSAIKLVSADDEEAANAEAMIAWDPPDGLIASLSGLKGVVSLGQGVDHIMDDPTFPRHLTVVRLVDPYMSEAMAEWVLLAILARHRDMEAYQQAKTRHEWIQIKPKIACEHTVAVLGLGAIGGHVAQKISALDFRTLGWSRSPKTIDGVMCLNGREGFSQCLNEADYIVSLLPLTDQTRDLFNDEIFATMKKGAYFINAGRGLQIDENALLNAVETGHLSGACLDVFRTEPLPSNHPLWTHPGITVWPHVSAQTNPPTAAAQVAEAVTAIHEGTRPQNIVDIKRGY